MLLADLKCTVWYHTKRLVWFCLLQVCLSLVPAAVDAVAQLPSLTGSYRIDSTVPQTVYRIDQHK